MLIQLDRVVFDHTAGAGNADGLSIRVDGTTDAPDWIRGDPRTSYAAYALVPTLNQPLTIQAHFSFPDPSLTPSGPVQVRARAIDPDHRVIGEVAPAAVRPPGGSVMFDLVGVEMWNRGTGTYEVSWQWQFQLTASSAWIDFERSDHVVYVTLDIPNAPWTQGITAAERQRWPWTRVLDWACRWGADVTLTSTGPAGASKKVVKKLEAGLFGLGQRDAVPLTYRFAGDAVYTEDFPNRVFFCTEFVDLLDGRPAAGFGTEVNCSDYASALATFANALGCDVLQKRISHRDELMLRTNRVVLIGESPDHPETHFFVFHEFVVRVRASDSALLVHDALLKIDVDQDPMSTDEHHTFDLAEGRELGAFIQKPSTLRYAHRLFKPEQWDAGVLDDLNFRCIDDCLGVANPPDRIIARRFHLFRAQIDRLAPLDSGIGLVDLKPPVVPGFTLYDRVDNPRYFARMKPLVTRSAVYFYAAVDDPGGRDQRVSISIAECESALNAREALAWLLAQTDALPAMPADITEPGGMAFRTRGNAALHYVRGNALVRIVNSGKVRVPFERISDALDRRDPTVGIAIAD